jgi:hypothetical protein
MISALLGFKNDGIFACGRIGIGDVTLDLFILKPNPRTVAATIFPKKIKNFGVAEVIRFRMDRVARALNI